MNRRWNFKRNTLKDAIGERHGTWTVLARAGTVSSGAARWHVRCDCGYERYSSGSTLRHKPQRCPQCSGGRETQGATERSEVSLRDQRRGCAPQYHKPGTKMYREQMVARALAEEAEAPVIPCRCLRCQSRNGAQLGRCLSCGSPELEFPRANDGRAA